MKISFFKYSLGLTLLVGLGAIAPATAAVQSPANPSSTMQLAQAPGDFLQVGDEGAAVAVLQQALGHNGLYNPLDVDGYYGPLTENAVRKYQANRGLPVTGVADVETLYALGITDVMFNRALLVYPGYGELSTDSLTPNDEGFDVQVLQLVLRNELLHDDTVMLNGIYDGATRQAVRVFQRTRGIDVTGIADRDTLLEMGFQDPAFGTDRIGGPEGPGIASDATMYYAIVVAGRNRLDTVQQTFDDAFIISTVRGEVISIGAFSSLRSAQAQVSRAQGQGFQAQVIDGTERY